MTSDRDPGHDGGELVGVLRDPIRRRLLFVLNDRPQGVTIRQLARRLREPPRRVRHYVELLVAAGLVAVEDQRPRRGTIERVLRATRDPLLWLDDWPSRLELTDTKLILVDILRLTFDTLTDAIATGNFAERRGWCAVRTWREVDAKGWEELADIHQRAAGEVTSAVYRSTERLLQSGEDGIPTISALFFFEALPWGMSRSDPRC